MGNYNPQAPIILGEEWVPIRDEDVSFSPVVNAVERGQAFGMTGSSQVRDARFYLNQAPGPRASFQVAAFNLYPYGLESLTGPISQVIIPVRSATTTGSSILTPGAANPTEALYQPGDGKYMQFTYNAGANQSVGVFFAVNDYPVLSGKRILNVSLVYCGGVQDYDANALPIDFVMPDSGTSLTVVSQTNDAGNNQQFNGPVFGSVLGSLSQLNTVVGTSGDALFGAPIAYLDIGDVNNGWNSAAVGNTTEKLPWRYTELQRFEPSAGATRQYIKLNVVIPQTTNGYTPAGGGTRSQVLINYMALRVIYCEERRIAYGGQQFAYNYGMNPITVRDTSQATDPTIGPGFFLPTLSFVSMGDVGFGGVISEFPKINGNRQLYELTSHPGVEVDIPFPIADNIGKTFTEKSSPILPQLSLHASGGPLTQPHVYGRQAWGQVYSTNTVTQQIYDDISGVSAAYPQVRFYARRFGNTTVPLTLTGQGVFAGYTTSIDAETFDALPEILNGVREVTLRFTSAPTMGTATGLPGWQFSAKAESSGNRWEVLGASAPAISGIPGSFFTLVPTPNQLGTATYQPPSGTGAAMTWMPQGVASVWVTSASVDPATDAVLMFSQDPLTVTGISLTQTTQAVSGIGALCGLIPCCIPTGIGYNRLTWSMPPGASVVRDSFSRTVVTGLGNPDVGTGPYALTDVGSAYSVNGSEARIAPSTTFVTSFATLDVGSPDFDVTAEVGSITNVVAGTSIRAYLTGRFTDANNNYAAFIQSTEASGASVLVIEKTVGGSTSNLVVISSPLSIDGGGRVWMRFMGYGSGGVGAWLKVKVWAGTQEDEPTAWLIETNDTSLTTGNRAGIGGQTRGAGNTTAIDNLLITPPRHWFGGYELQRWDAVTGGDFQTIMLATDITTTAFSDFEPRVGQQSVYRIRALNAYNFAGLWSTYVSGAPPAPGVTGGCSDMTGALIFTANGDQTGANNAAYVMQWDGTPNESFDLPEAGQVQYQPMYGRDGVVAFHGTERGLETFRRNVLLEAGAIALPSLANANTIRDLAWEQLPYVCVRDSRGNRWFASVRVPTVQARNDAQNYNAAIEVVEATRTPYPVDP